MSRPPTTEVATIALNDHSDVPNDAEEPHPKQPWLRTYLSKWTGQHIIQESPRIKLSECAISFLGTLLSVAILGVIHYRLLSRRDLAFFIASFGASAVLLYGLPSSPLSQPRNVIGGQVISAIVGCVFRLMINAGGETFLAIALSVSVTTFLMQVTDTMHAPAGATAVIAITTGTPFAWAGFQFVLMPVLTSSLILTIIAVVVNNLVSGRHYPCRWW